MAARQRGSPARVAPEAAIALFLSSYTTTSERIAAIQAALKGKSGESLRRQLGGLVVRLVPVESLVPEDHRQWRPLVKEAMLFVVSRLSAARLAPKIVEQLELPPATPYQERLLRLIAKVPGLQKIGQVLARNRALDPELRHALSQLENGISDAGIDEIREILFRQLAAPIAEYGVKVDSAIFSEASVSAVVRFTWRNPASGRRERGVFKVLKPHIPGCYAEDMGILHRLASHLADKHRDERVSLAGVAETLAEIRRLLEHEVDFRREQTTLGEAARLYQGVGGVRVPRTIEPLCTPTITALTHEKGVKVTNALKRPGPARVRLAGRMVELLMAVPALSRGDRAMFHADPHAGNLLYDTRTRQLVILDWALTERLTREQRKRVLLLVLMTMLRDKEGICRAIERLRLHDVSDDAAQARMIREDVGRFIEALPLFYVPGVMDAMHLLHDIAMHGALFPGALLMFRKASFTLDGVLADVAGAPVRMDTVLARYALANWADTAATLWSMLSPGDLATLEWSAALFAWRMALGAVLHPWKWIAMPAMITGAPPILPS